MPYWRSGGGGRLITNAGGLNPLACAQACRRLLDDGGAGRLTIAVVSGDDVLPQILSDARRDPEHTLSRNLDTGEPIASVADCLVTANAYLGAEPLIQALDQRADIVITGRVADPSLTVAACAHHFGSGMDEWDRLAGATVAGHLIECGTQVTGGISTDWLDVPDVWRIGFPIVEVAQDGGCVVTKPDGTGGRVTERTVKEQLLYEIGDPDQYLSPDVTASFLTLEVDSVGKDRVRVRGATGRPAPESLKVSATYRGGYRADGHLTIIGEHAIRKAQSAAESIFTRLEQDGVSFAEQAVECLGAGYWSSDQTRDANETVLRVAVADESKPAVEAFARSGMPLITAGPPGTTGYSDGRPKVRELIRFWPCLIERSRVMPQVEFVPVAETAERSSVRRGIGREISGVSFQLATDDREISGENDGHRKLETDATAPCVLADLAYGRSGDKGINANIGVLARQPNDYPLLLKLLTSERVAGVFGLRAEDVQRFEAPNLGGINFVLHGVLRSSLRTDAQGKALAQVLLAMPLCRWIHDRKLHAPEVAAGHLSTDTGGSVGHV